LSPDYKLLELLYQSKADPFKRIDKPDTAVTIYDGDGEMQLMTLGNFSAISGKMKTGKTHLISAIIAASLSGGDVIDKFRGDLPDGKENIIYFDTEQAPYDFQWTMKKIVDLSGLSHSEINERVSFHRLREFNKEIRVDLIDAAIRTTPNVGLVVIDGIREMVLDINNPEESTIAIGHIMRWTDVYHLHVMTVLHQNPAGNTGNKLRGHIGTEAMNKAEVVISVNREEDADHAIIRADWIRREKKFADFGLGHDADKLPYVLDVEQKGNKKIVWDVPGDTDMSDHEYIVGRLFENNKSYSLSSFNETSKNLLLMMSINTSSRKVKEWVNHWLTFDLISIKVGDQKNRKIVTKKGS